MTGAPRDLPRYQVHSRAMGKNNPGNDIQSRLPYRQAVPCIPPGNCHHLRYIGDIGYSCHGFYINNIIPVYNT